MQFFRLPLALALLGCTASMARAQFAMSVAVGRTYTSNAAYVEPTRSDQVTNYDVSMSYTQETRIRTWRVSYIPSYRAYDEAGELDDLDHTGRMEYRSALNPVTSFWFDVNYAKTQTQEAIESLDSPSTVLTYRTEREFLWSTVGLTREVEQGWTWSGSVRPRLTRIESISDFDSGVPAAQLGDQNSYELALESSTAASASTRVGWTAGFIKYRLDLSEDEDIRRAAARVQHELSPNVTAKFDLGVGHRTDGDEATVEGSAELDRVYRNGSFAVRATRAMGNGDTMPGPYIANEVRMVYSRQSDVRWGWAASGRYSQRDRGSAEPGLNHARIGLDLSYRTLRSLAHGPLRGLAFRLSGYLVEQSGHEDHDLNSSYNVVSAAVVTDLGPRRRGGE